jgi:hypothetical protein
MTYNEILERIENAQTCCELEELRTTIAQSCDDCEITENQYRELRMKCEHAAYDLPTQNALDATEREDLEKTYFDAIKLR